jgi:hypothetical protein
MAGTRRAVASRAVWRAALVSAAVALALAAAPERAFARPKFQGVGAASIGYTDNVHSSPDPPVPGVPEKTGDAFTLISPGVVMASTSRGVVHRVGYTYTLSLFLRESDANSSSNRLDYTGFFDLTPRTTLLLGASVLQSARHTTGIIPSADSTPLSSAVPGTTPFVSLRGEEGLFGVFQTPITDEPAPRTYETGARLGVERLFLQDAVGVEGRANYSVVTGGTLPDGRPAGNQRQLVTAGVGRWRHDWGRDFTSRLEAGVMRVQRLDSGLGFWEPTGAAALAYAIEDGEAEIFYQHTASTSPLLGQSFVVDEVRLRGALPLADEGVVMLSSSIGYQHGRVIADDATLATTLDLYLVDVALGWQATDEWLLDVRYQHTQQLSDAEEPPLPLSFVRNTVLIGAALTFPPDREMPRRYRPPRRVDQSDELYEARDPVSGARDR